MQDLEKENFQELCQLLLLSLQVTWVVSLCPSVQAAWVVSVCTSIFLDEASVSLLPVAIPSLSQQLPLPFPTGPASSSLSSLRSWKASASVASQLWT